MQTRRLVKKQDRKIALNKLNQRILKDISFDKSSGLITSQKDNTLSEVLYWEQERLSKEKNTKSILIEKAFWKKISLNFYKLSEVEIEAKLKEIVQRFSEEIIGGFNPKLHTKIAQIIPYGIKALFTRFSPKTYLKQLNNQTLEESLVISGSMAQIAELAKSGTIIYTPNHASNFDSIALGYALFKSKLPPVLYGAGINLFTNPVISFLMNNLGAYRVDRKKKSKLYKNVLKTYACISMEMGYHNLFFPGGTRSRSGEIEQHLKLGLIGSGLSAYIENLKTNKEKPNFYVVPCTINYGLSLEAETLIKDHLKETGKNRFIIVKDESCKLIKVLGYLRKLRTLQSQIHIHFAQPMDLFGNQVNSLGESLDQKGRVVDPSKYLINCRDTKIEHDTQRDREYTILLGSQILESLKKSNVIMSTHLTAFVLFNLYRNLHPQMEFYRFLKMENLELSESDIISKFEDTKRMLEEKVSEGEVKMDENLKDLSPESILQNALNQFSSFYSRRTLFLKNGKVYCTNLKLLYYYRNRLAHYGMDKINVN